MDTKQCRKCGETKILLDFHKKTQNKDGWETSCKECANEYKRQHPRSEASKEKNKLYIRNRRASDPEFKKKELLRKNEYDNKNRDLIRAKDRERIKTPEFKEKRRQKRKNDPLFRFAMNARGRISMALKTAKKVDRTVALLGCSIAELRLYLESLFTEGMSWDNYGYYGWHIDHIIPCSAFDFRNPEDQRKCFHYTNLQPLWATDNMRKSDKIIKKDLDDPPE